MQTIASDDQFHESVAKETLPIVAVFGAPWCGNCRMLKPKLATLCDELKNQVIFLQTDTTELEDLSIDLEVQSLPHFIFYSKGKKEKDYTGSKWDVIENMIRSHASNQSDPQQEEPSKELQPEEPSKEQQLEEPTNKPLPEEQSEEPLPEEPTNKPLAEEQSEEPTNTPLPEEEESSNQPLPEEQDESSNLKRPLVDSNESETPTKMPKYDKSTNGSKISLQYLEACGLLSLKEEWEKFDESNLNSFVSTVESWNELPQDIQYESLYMIQSPEKDPLNLALQIYQLPYDDELIKHPQTLRLAKLNKIFNELAITNPNSCYALHRVFKKTDGDDLLVTEVCIGNAIPNITTLQEASTNEFIDPALNGKTVINETKDCDDMYVPIQDANGIVLGFIHMKATQKDTKQHFFQLLQVGFDLGNANLWI